MYTQYPCIAQRLHVLMKFLYTVAIVMYTIFRFMYAYTRRETEKKYKIKTVSNVP